MRISDWSSDVCSSDLAERAVPAGPRPVHEFHAAFGAFVPEHRTHLVALELGVGVVGVRELDPQRCERTQVVQAAAQFAAALVHHDVHRSEEHTSELQSLMRISYAVFCLKTKK